MRRISICFAITAVMFLIPGLAFADPAFTVKSEGNVDMLINRGSSSNYGNLQYASDSTLLWAIGLRGVGPDDSLFFHDENGGGTRMMIDGTSGYVGIGTTDPFFPLEMASGAHVTIGGVWTDASSREYKENIANLTQEEAISALDKLNPVKFNYKVQKDEEYIGFIAEDVPDLVATGDRKSLGSMDIIAVLTKVVQQQQKQIADLEARLNASPGI
jgi:hypothetical protein